MHVISKYLFILISVLLVCSCNKEVEISEELVGKWNYHREAFNNLNEGKEVDTEGRVNFYEGNTGHWISNDSGKDFTLEWELEDDDSRIYMMKTPWDFQNEPVKVRTYDIKRYDEDNFELRYMLEQPWIHDSIDVYIEYENILLSRIR